MRWNLFGVKFGHVPGTPLSPTQQAQQARPRAAVPTTRPGRVSVQAPGRGVSALLQQNAPERPNIGRAHTSITIDDDAAIAGIPRPPLHPDDLRWRAPASAGRPDPPGDRLSAPAGRNDSTPLVQAMPLGHDARPPLADMPVAPALVYQRNRGQTLRSFTDADVLNPPRLLGLGSFNSVFAVKLKAEGGGVIDGVFKPVASVERGAVAIGTGIPIDSPHSANRNIATADYAKALGFDVIVDTGIAHLTVPRPDDVLSGPRFGLVMRHAQGHPAARTAPDILAMPNVIREVTKLQLLDHLTAQGDRHANNYFVHIEANGQAKVTGIDNDQCFGKNVTDPDDIRYESTPERYFFRGTRMPPVVDHDMAIAISSVGQQDLRDMLSDKLSSSEVQAAIARLDGVKRHISELEGQGRVISPQEWGSPTVRNLMDGSNSYIERDYVKNLQSLTSSTW